MQHPNYDARYRNLMIFFAGLTSSVAFWDVVLPLLGLRSLARRTRPARYRRIAANFRVMAVRMGGVMIKVGQFLSARLDVMPAEITEELAKLQDEVPAEDFVAIRELAESELGARLETVFEMFEPVPMAAASLGQVHRARLPLGAMDNGDLRDVVVKIQRPLVKQLIDVDFLALRRFGGWLQLYKPIRDRVNVLALIQELADVVHREIDYVAEATNADTFRANFSDRKRVCVPRVIWSRTTERVLTLEDVYAIKITDYDAIEAAGISRISVAETLFDTYLKQIFEDHFFHADPHPGNLFVNPQPREGAEDRTSWQLTFVDFGMVGSVPAELQRGLREMLVGIGTRDAAKVVEAYQTLGVLLPNADVELLGQAEARMFDRFWGMSISELRQMGHAEMHQFARQFRELLLAMPFQIPHNLLLLGRALAILSGMCAGLDPDFNVWRQLEPYARKLMVGEQQSEWEGWLDQAGELVKELITLPGQTSKILTRLARGELQFTLPQVSRQIYHLETAVNRLFGGLMCAVFLLAGVFFYRSGEPLPTYVFWGASGAALLWTAFLSRGHSP
jgi:predicted unusual protein kinase regulating ubiquinone biosynthesis (AarF/ABC1/UbiB family)